MNSIDQKLRELDVQLPDAPPRAGVYRQTKPFGEHLLYVSGCGPDLNGVQEMKGKLGELSIEEGQEAARRCMLNALAILRRDLGSLDRVKSIVKLLCFVSSKDDFYEQPSVANGASQFLNEVFGEAVGCPSRSAIGVNVLPGNIPVEIEMTVEVHG